jgi:hypothetical protein
MAAVNLIVLTPGQASGVPHLEWGPWSHLPELGNNDVYDWSETRAVKEILDVDGYIAVFDANTWHPDLCMSPMLEIPVSNDTIRVLAHALDEEAQTRMELGIQA